MAQGIAEGFQLATELDWIPTPLSLRPTEERPRSQGPGAGKADSENSTTAHFQAGGK